MNTVELILRHPVATFFIVLAIGYAVTEVCVGIAAIIAACRSK